MADWGRSRRARGESPADKAQARPVSHEPDERRADARSGGVHGGGGGVHLTPDEELPAAARVDEPDPGEGCPWAEKADALASKPHGAGRMDAGDAGLTQLPVDGQLEPDYRDLRTY